MDAKVAARELLELCLEKQVNFPSLMDEAKKMQVCGATLMLYRNGESFALNEALESLIEKFGRKNKDFANTKRAISFIADGDIDQTAGPKKIRKVDTVVVEANRNISEAIKEMGDICFKNKDSRKGGVFSRAAKALREANFEILCAKDAIGLKGIGKGIAGYVQEFLETGTITKLEELRSGL